MKHNFDIDIILEDNSIIHFKRVLLDFVRIMLRHKEMNDISIKEIRIRLNDN